MEYITRLNNYDGEKIAEIALGEPYCLFEEAFAIYNKMDLPINAIDVIINHIGDVQRAAEYA